jgi:DNA topoisomerase-1
MSERPARRAGRQNGDARPGVPDVAAGVVEAAKAGGLRYVRDTDAGIRRRRRRSAFVYYDARNVAIRDAEQLTRIRALAIPPAWRAVWICSDPRGHLQATGRDARGRKQYRYHPRWRQLRDATKYERMLGFGAALGGLRGRIRTDLGLPGLPRTKVVATVVRLLDRTFIRVGNEEYARQNQSYGLTTLRDAHVDVSGATVRFQFPGKSRKPHAVEVDDRRAARVIRRCQDLPGQELFQYLDEAGERQAVGSADVNDYLRAVTGQEFTAKDFRTWGASVLAAAALRAVPAPRSAAEARRRVSEACRRVSERLGNTPAICRNSYVHPAVLDAHADGVLADSAALHVPDQAGLSQDEAFLLAFLRALNAADRPVRRRAAGPHARPSRRRRTPPPGRARRPARDAG